MIRIFDLRNKKAVKIKSNFSAEIELNGNYIVNVMLYDLLLHIMKHSKPKLKFH